MPAHYVLSKSYGHIFRYQFPRDIKPLVGKSEIRLSLRTRELGLAKSRSRMIAGRLQMLIRTLRKGEEMAQLKAEQINKIINQYLKEALEEDEKARILNNRPIDQDFHEKLTETFSAIPGMLQADLAKNDMNYIKALACDLLDKHGLETDRDSFEYKMFCRECSKAFIRLFDIEQKRPDQQRQAFTDTHLNQMFQSPEYLEDTHQQSFQFWLPILGLYTGARLNELCQLRLNDIQTFDNIMYLHLQEDPEDPTISLKNAASHRTIPLHPFVTNDLNFQGYVDHLKET